MAQRRKADAATRLPREGSGLADLLIFRIRKARIKARALAAAEAVALLADFGAAAAPGGPLGDQSGVFWIDLPDDHLKDAIPRLPRLGYSESVNVLEPVAGSARYDIQWRGQRYRIASIYREDAGAVREQAPDRRVFLLESESGVVRPVRGYRGDGQVLSRRGLPVYDARLLVNLTGANAHTTLLDPFAGIGGIVLAATASGCRVLSLDIDPALRFGLRQTGARHAVGDARALPYPDSSINAVATEPPYDEQALDVVRLSLAEMARVLKPGGSLTLLCTAAQAGTLRKAALHLSLTLWLDEALDRKGLPCVLLAWRKVVEN